MDNDNRKLRWTLIPFDALRCVAKVFTDGARKHSDNGWKHVDNPIRMYADALMRHVDDYMEGRRIDDDSGSPVMAHVAANALILLWHGLNSADWETTSEDRDPAADIFGLSPEDRKSVVGPHDPFFGLDPSKFPPWAEWFAVDEDGCAIVYDYNVAAVGESWVHEPRTRSGVPHYYNIVGNVDLNGINWWTTKVRIPK